MPKYWVKALILNYFGLRQIRNIIRNIFKNTRVYSECKLIQEQKERNLAFRVYLVPERIKPKVVELFNLILFFVLPKFKKKPHRL